MKHLKIILILLSCFSVFGEDCSELAQRISNFNTNYRNLSPEDISPQTIKEEGLSPSHMSQTPLKHLFSPIGKVDFLKNEKISFKLKFDNQNSVNDSSTKVIIFPDESKAVWKGHTEFLFSNYRAEVYAYEIHRYLEIANVPVTTERRIDNKVGSIQEYIRSIELNKSHPNYKDQMSEIDIFDFIINNRDRKKNGEHLLFTDSGEIYSIDHGISMTSDMSGVTHRKFIDYKEGVDHFFSDKEKSIHLMSKIEMALSDDQFKDVTISYFGKQDYDKLIIRLKALRSYYHFNITKKLDENFFIEKLKDPSLSTYELNILGDIIYNSNRIFQDPKKILKLYISHPNINKYSLSNTLNLVKSLKSGRTLFHIDTIVEKMINSPFLTDRVLNAITKLLTDSPQLFVGPQFIEEAIVKRQRAKETLKNNLHYLLHYGTARTALSIFDGILTLFPAEDEFINSSFGKIIDSPYFGDIFYKFYKRSIKKDPYNRIIIGKLNLVQSYRISKKLLHHIVKNRIPAKNLELFLQDLLFSHDLVPDDFPLILNILLDDQFKISNPNDLLVYLIKSIERYVLPEEVLKKIKYKLTFYDNPKVDRARIYRALIESKLSLNRMN